MSARLDRKSWRELPAFEGIDSRQSLSFLDQLCQLVGRLFDLIASSLWVSLGTRDEHKNRIVPAISVSDDPRSVNQTRIRWLFRNQWHESIGVQRISTFRDTSCLQKFGDCVSSNLDLAKQLFWSGAHRTDVDCNHCTAWPNAVINVGKIAYEFILFIRTWIRPGKQAHVKPGPGSIHHGCRVAASNEHPSAMAAFIRVPLQRSAPSCWTLRTVAERVSDGQKPRVRKTPFLDCPQTRETTKAERAHLTVRKSLVFRTDRTTGVALSSWKALVKSAPLEGVPRVRAQQATAPILQADRRFPRYNVSLPRSEARQRRKSGCTG